MEHTYVLSVCFIKFGRVYSAAKVVVSPAWRGTDNSGKSSFKYSRASDLDWHRGSVGRIHREVKPTWDVLR